VERGGHRLIFWRMRIACWARKSTNTHSERVILIALPQQKWLPEHTSMLLYTNRPLPGLLQNYIQTEADE